MPFFLRRVRPATRRPGLEPLEPRINPAPPPGVTILETSFEHAEGTPITLMGELTDPSGNPLPSIPPNLTLHWTVTRFATLYTESFITGGVADFTFLPDDNGQYTVTLEVLGDGGFFNDPDIRSLFVENLPPTVSITGLPGGEGPLTVGAFHNLGSQITDPGTADTFQVIWQVRQNGVNLGFFTDPRLFVPTTPGFYEFNVRVQDDDGAEANSSVALYAEIVLPIVDAGPDQTVEEGDLVTLVGSFTHPADALPQQETWIVQRGEDIVAVGTGSTVRFLARDDGPYLATLTVTDPFGNTVTDTVEVRTNNVAPVVDAGPDLALPLGRSAALTGTFQDPGPDDTHTLFWQVFDAAGVAVGGGTDATIEFLAPQAGSYTAVFTVLDDDGGLGIDSMTVLAFSSLPAPLPNVPPTPPTSPPESAPTAGTPSAPPGPYLSPLPTESVLGTFAPPALLSSLVPEAGLTLPGIPASYRFPASGGGDNRAGGSGLATLPLLGNAPAGIASTAAGNTLVASEVRSIRLDPAEERTRNVISVETLPGIGLGRKSQATGIDGGGDSAERVDPVKTKVLQTITSVTVEDDSVHIVETLVNRPSAPTKTVSTPGPEGVSANDEPDDSDTVLESVQGGTNSRVFRGWSLLSGFVVAIASLTMTLRETPRRFGFRRTRTEES